jgi:hypothetical protein
MTEREEAVEFFVRLGPFWTVGILLNLTVTTLAVWWVVRSMRARRPDRVEGHRAGEDIGREE